MRPDQPHSFRPRNPTTAEGRTTCAVCAQPTDAPTHDPLQLFRQSIEYTAKQFGVRVRAPRWCTELGCKRSVRARGKCRLHDGRLAIVSTSLRPAALGGVDRAAASRGLSRGAWLRELIELELRRVGDPSVAGVDAPGHADQQVPEG